MDLLEGLNEPQREAVLHENGPLLIFAGAGSGKTRTLTHRIAHLISQRNVPPARILAVTFTNKAAKEMRERLSHILGAAASRVWMGTFHAMCAQMLRISGSYIGIDPRFVIFDSDDTTRLMKDVLKGADIDSERYPASRVLARISDAKNNMKSPAEMADNASSPNDRVIARLFKTYQERLRQSNALDFDDLLGECVRLLRDSEEARTYWSERFLHVLIDEFQDVNAAQFQWAQLLASRHRNICVVGDDDQSIYAWRGANVRIILDFEVDYPDARVIRLEQNYRSTQPILDAAHGVISKNLGRKPKRLWTEKETPISGAKVRVHGTANAQEEAAWLVRQINLLQRERATSGGTPELSDYAILCRVNAQSRPFEEAFMRARLPLRLVGTQRFYERREVKDLIAYLKLLYNSRDDIAMARVVNVPARGIGAVTVEKLQILARQSDRSLLETICDENTQSELGGAVAAKIAPLRELLLQLQRDVETALCIADALTAVIDRTDYLDFLSREKTLDSVDRIANVQELLRATQDFDERIESGVNPREYSRDYLDEEESAPADEPLSTHEKLGLFLETSALEGAGDSGAEGSAVTLMTLHSAKGLEFPVAFLVGAEQGLLPHARALWGEGAGGDELEEERRLCYVGLTRAREQVFLSYAAQRTMHGKTETTQPSQFIEEIPPQLLERGGLAASGASSYRSATSWDSPSSGGGGTSYANVSRPPSTSASTREAILSSRTENSAAQFAVGQRVSHPEFGEGLVVAASPSGGRGEWVEVAFLRAVVGKKKLVVAFAPLTLVES